MKHFNAGMLTLARESREYTQAELSSRSGIPQTLLSRFEGGVAVPSFDLAESLAKATDYPAELFYEHDRIYGFNASVFFHRKRSDMPAKTLKRVHAALNLTRMRLDRLLLAGEIRTSMDLVRMSIEDHDSPEQIAQKLRAILQLPDGPVANLTETLEEAGVVIVQYEFHSRRMDAVSEWVPGHPPIVMMNVDEHVPGDRYRWTLAHELGHLIMHSYPVKDIEEQANRFAAEFLLPAKELRPRLRSVRLQTLALLKSIWKVSMAALLERAKQLGTISVSAYRYMRINFGKLGYIKQEPEELAIPIEKPDLFSELIELHTRTLGYSLSDLASLLRMKDHELSDSYLSFGGLHLINAKPFLRRA